MTTAASTRDLRWLDRVGLNYAHQGGAKEAPSSTMHAFRRAIELGAQGLEMDVHCTADAQLVVAHDHTVDRTASGSGRIDQLDLATLRSMDFGHWWVPGHDAVAGLSPESYPLRGRGPQDVSFRIVTLKEVLAAFPDTLLNFDIKGGSVPYEDLLADCLRAYANPDTCIVASFDDAMLNRFRSHAPEFATSSAVQESWQLAGWFQGGRQPEQIAPSLVAMQIPYRFEAGGDPLFDAAFVERAHDRGCAIHVWTVDDPDDMHELLDLGVDALMTDKPSVAEAVFAERATQRWRPTGGSSDDFAR